MSVLFTGMNNGGRGYPQEFLDELAKAWGIKWTKVEFKTLKEDIDVCPIPPPSGILYYLDYHYTPE